MPLQVHQLALDAVAASRRIVPRIKRHDKDLAEQLKGALSSAALNIGEAEYSDDGNKRARLHTAAGSANESRSAINVALAWGYIAPAEAAPALELLDRVVAMLYRLLHGRR